jgi:hypothetical protein
MSTLKFIAVLAGALLTLAALIVFVPSYTVSAEDGQASEAVTYRYTGVKSDADRREFLCQFGLEATLDEATEVEVTIPSEFDKVFAAYNELQREQGFDLSKYRKKTVTRYTYTLKNFENEEGTVYVNLIIYRNRVIGADICSADVSGFICGLEGREG